MNPDDPEEDAKRRLRVVMRDRLRAIPAGDRGLLSRAACDAVVRAPWFGRARAVFAFVSLPHEIDTDELLRAILLAGKTLAVPRVAAASGQLEAIVVSDPAGLERGTFGVREPRSGDLATLSADDVVLVPGLAFDRSGGRLGRGGGFFDRWLALHEGPLTCGLAFAQQVVERVPMQARDRRVRWLATESGVIRCS